MFAGLAALGAALTVIAYVPYAEAGLSGLSGNAISVGENFSTGSPPNVLRRLITFVLSLTWMSDAAAATIGMRLARTVSTLLIALLLFVAARRLWRAPRRDPWPVLAWYFLGYLLFTPWVFYWHEIPLLAIVAVIPWGLTSLVAVIASASLLPQAAALRGWRPVVLPNWIQLLSTIGGFLAYYAAPIAVAWYGWRNRGGRFTSAAISILNSLRRSPAPEPSSPEPIEKTSTG
jgi:hypothetical protein